MKPAPFTYAAPSTVEDAIALLAVHGDSAKLLAGGQSLMPMLNFRLLRPAYLIDLNRVPGLDTITARDGVLVVGAMTRQRRLEQSEIVRQHYPLLAAAAALIGHAATRNRGTVGGSLVHADPAAELPALLLAYGGSVVLQGPQGRRQVPAAEFFVTYLTTAVDPTEILVEVHFPRWPRGTGWGFLEESRRHGDFALVGVAALLTCDASRRCTQVAVALTGVGGVPHLVTAASSLLLGQVPDEARLAAAAQAAASSVEPESDIHASAEFRRHLSGVLTRRALQQAVERAFQATNSALGGTL